MYLQARMLCVRYTWLSTEVRRRAGTSGYPKTGRLHVAYTLLITDVIQAQRDFG